MSQLGLILRDAALDHSKQGRESRIAAVREELLTRHTFQVVRWPNEVVVQDTRPSGTFTADDVYQVAERLGFLEGDVRWLGNICRNWSAVRKTDRVVNSRLPQRHARPVAVWEFR